MSMQSSTIISDHSFKSLGERRGNPDLARFSLDLSWARAVTDAARTRAYPSPPMSGSPPLRPQSNPAFDDRGPAGFGTTSSLQDASQGMRTPQTEPQRNIGAAVPRGPYHEEQHVQSQYPSYERTESISIAQPQSQYQYQQQQPILQHPQRQPQQMGAVAHYPPPPHDTFQGLERPPIGEPPGYTSPKSMRKTKGHVASACVPCKKAHLRCDAQRPCSRCMSNGKEDACIDVQHKKRGRPRLRDDREVRYEGMGPAYPPPPDHVMRRPMPMYTTSEPTMHDPSMPSRSGPYRVLKSQSGPPAPRYLHRASVGEANLYTASSAAQPRIMGPSEAPCAYLSTDFQVAKASRSFSEALGMPSLLARKLTEMVIPGDRDKLYRIQKIFEDERKQREPNYLPPIYGRSEEDRVIQTIGVSTNDLSQFRADMIESLNFQGPDGQQRNFQVRMGLSKKESTFFVVLILDLPVTPQGMHHSLSSPFTREPQYGYQTSQQQFDRPPSMSPYAQYPQPYSEPRAREQSMGYRQPAPLGSNIGHPPGPSPPIAGHQYAPPYPRHNYGHGQHPHEIPRSQILQGQTSRPNELQLPPIRTQAAPVAGMPVSRGEDRPSRLDIGGLIEGPDSQRRRP